MRSTAALLFLLVLAAGSVACHDHHSSPSEPGGETPQVEGHYLGSALYAGGDPAYQEFHVLLEIKIEQQGHTLTGSWIRTLPSGDVSAYRIAGEILEGGIQLKLTPASGDLHEIYDVTAGFEESSGGKGRLTGYGEIPGCVGCYSFTFLVDETAN